jgi:hypothetical protein
MYRLLGAAELIGPIGSSDQNGGAADPESAGDGQL